MLQNIDCRELKESSSAVTVLLLGEHAVDAFVPGGDRCVVPAVRGRVDVLLHAVWQRVVDRVDRSRRTGEVNEAG